MPVLRCPFPLGCPLPANSLTSWPSELWVLQSQVKKEKKWAERIKDQKRAVLLIILQRAHRSWLRVMPVEIPTQCLLLATGPSHDLRVGPGRRVWAGWRRLALLCVHTWACSAGSDTVRGIQKGMWSFTSRVLSLLSLCPPVVAKQVCVYKSWSVPFPHY